jgi:hypothetical protein
MTGLLVATALGSLLLSTTAASAATTSTTAAGALPPGTALLVKALTTSSLAKTVTVSGTANQGKTVITLDVQASNSPKAQGEITISGAVVHAIRLGANVFFTANQKFWTQNGGATAASLFAGRWVETAAASNDGASLAAFLSVNTLFHELFSGNITTATFVRGKNTTVNGVPVLSLSGKDKIGGTSGVIYIQRTGKPYLIQLKSSGGAGGKSLVNFSAYNQPIRPVAPKNAIDIDKLKPQTSG